MNKIEIYCVTNIELDYLEKLNLKLAGVGNKKFNKNYISCFEGKNIQHKEKNYSELTFHYWFWKNRLNKIHKDSWIGFCQKRRFWIKSKKKISNLNQLKKNLLKTPPRKWSNFESIICKSIKVDNPKKMKLLKRGYKNILKDPSIIFNKKKHNIKLHFDMHHGHGILDQAIDYLNQKDRIQFRDFVNKNNSFNPHIMFISKKKIINKWFKSLFTWLFRCEKKFGLKNLKGYDQQRLYAYLAERYLSFWFKKNTKYLEWDWTFFEKNQTIK
ncbi:DUF4422 domain-containing protein [Candidatus Pelagibacter ubique]|jgi:hypothetical protein|nr:DUF4422 domain-containing protein [Candidatus Pelagibacter ubique]